jgi:hypothetical protein
MMQDHIPRLSKVLAALDILSPTSFDLGGEVFETQNQPPIPLGPDGDQPQHPLVGLLGDTLYTQAYTQRFEGKRHTPLILQETNGDLVEILSEANNSRERWAPGWRIGEVMPSGQVVAHKDGATRTLWAGEFVTQDGPGISPRPGTTITIYTPRESSTAQPGFYFAFGEEANEPNDSSEAVRFYWNVGVSGASHLVAAITRTLNRFWTPFRLKCCSRREFFSRIDAAVLYVSRRHYRITAEALVPVYDELRPYLASETPLFARPLAPGLAFAEEPGTGESFGSFCCRIVAEGIWSAYMQGEQGVEARLGAIEAQFARYFLDFARPYLRPGSVDTYEFPTYGSADDHDQV